MTDTSTIYGLTPTERDALLIIHELTEIGGGVSPTYREIMHELDLRSLEGISRLVRALESKGWLARLPFRTRSLRVLHLPPPRALDYDSAFVTAKGRSAISVHRRRGAASEAAR